MPNPPRWYLPKCIDQPVCPAEIDCYCKHVRIMLQRRVIERRYPTPTGWTMKA